MNLKNITKRITDVSAQQKYVRKIRDYYWENTPEAKMREKAQQEVQEWKKTFEPTILNIDYQDSNSCTVLLGDKNSDKTFIANCVGDGEGEFYDFAILPVKEVNLRGGEKPTEDWYFANAVDNELSTDESLFLTLYDILSGNIIFESEEENEDEL